MISGGTDFILPLGISALFCLMIPVGQSDAQARLPHLFFFE
jgi:hypothetical protein